MRVVTKLAQMEFRVGTIRREGDFLVMESDETQSMKVKAYIDATDVVRMFRSGMKRDVIGYLAGVPRRARKAKREKREDGRTQKALK
jgi:hypothetical protein